MPVMFLVESLLVSFHEQDIPNKDDQNSDQETWEKDVKDGKSN